MTWPPFGAGLMTTGLTTKSGKPVCGRKKNYDRNGGPFIMLRYGMLDSQAFNDLKGSAVIVLFSIMRRHDGYNGTVDDPITCPYSAMKCGLAPATIARALRELESHGFIERIVHGGLEKNPNQYVFLEAWKKWEKA